MKMTTLTFKDKEMLAFGTGKFKITSKEDMRELVDQINTTENYCGIPNPMVEINGISLLETLIRLKVNTDKLIYTDYHYVFHIKTALEQVNYEESVTYVIFPNQFKQLAFIMKVLIGWIKTIGKNHNQVDYNNIKLTEEFTGRVETNRRLKKQLEYIQENGFTSSININSTFGIDVNPAEFSDCFIGNSIAQLDKSKYYSIGIYMPQSNIRYYTNETYAEMMARHYKEKEALKVFGAEAYILNTRDKDGLRRKSKDRNRVFMDDIRHIKESYGFYDYSLAIIDFINEIVDNKTSFMIHNSGNIQIAFKNSVPVLEAMRKIVTATSNKLEKHMVHSLAIYKDGKAIRPWDTTFYGTCEFNRLARSLYEIDTGLKTRLSSKSSNAETDLISLFNNIKQTII